MPQDLGRLCHGGQMFSALGFVEFILNYAVNDLVWSILVQHSRYLYTSDRFINISNAETIANGPSRVHANRFQSMELFLLYVQKAISSGKYKTIYGVYLIFKCIYDRCISRGLLFSWLNTSPSNMKYTHFPPFLDTG